MPVLQREHIQQALSSIQGEYESVFEKLRHLPLAGEPALDVGCSSGYEAIAIQWFLGIKHVIGIDRDISTADQFVGALRADLADGREAVKLANLPQADREWWDSRIPQFLKDDRFPEFVQVELAHPGDLTRAIDTRLFGFAYCSNVLCHIHETHGRGGVRTAVDEILNALLPGAWFVAQEPIDKELEYIREELSSVAQTLRVSSNPFKIDYHAQR